MSRGKRHARSFVQVSTYATDPQYFGIGSGPNIGDLTGSALVTLATPTSDPHHRQMFRCCAFEVPRFRSARLVRYGQYQEIGQAYPQSDGSVFWARFPVNTPMWSFRDGNIATAIRVVRNAPPITVRSDIAKPLRASTDVYGVDPALLYVPDPAGGFGARYVPPQAGIPPGSGSGDLHEMHSLDHPWQLHTPFMDLGIDGPALVTMWMLLWQTDPATRGTRTLPDGYQISALTPEDRFLSQSTAAIYTRVAGSMTFELYPTAPMMTHAYDTGGDILSEALAWWDRIGRPKGQGG